jgi:hypothetical protein
MVLGDSSCQGRFAQCSCGEVADRTSLDLPGNQLLLLRAVLNATGNLAGLTPPDGSWVPYDPRQQQPPTPPTPVVVVLVHGRPATFDASGGNWLLPGLAPGSRAALVSSWRPSEAGALALLDLITGVGVEDQDQRETTTLTLNFGGRTSAAWPRSVGHVRSPGNPWLQWPNSQGQGAWFAPREGTPATASWAPLFPLGHGLSYTTFSVGNLTLPAQPVPRAALSLMSFFNDSNNSRMTSSGRNNSTSSTSSASSSTSSASTSTGRRRSGSFALSVDVRNDGALAGSTVVFVVFQVSVPGVLRRFQQLAAFERVRVLQPGEALPGGLTVQVTGDALQRWDEATGDFVVDAGVYNFSVGTCIDDSALLGGAPPCKVLRGSVTVV